MDNIKEQYEVVYDSEDRSRWFVKLTKAAGDWAGIAYSYGKFYIKEPETPEGNATFSFERDILFVPPHLRGKEFPDAKNVEFTTLLGKILYDILQDNLERAIVKGDKLVLELSDDQ